MAALTAGMDSQESVEWLASLRLDPPEEDRADVRHALLSALMAQLLTGKPQKPELFLEALPWRARSEAAPPPPTPVSIRRKIDAVMAMLGGKR